MENNVTNRKRSVSRFIIQMTPTSHLRMMNSHYSGVDLIKLLMSILAVFHLCISIANADEIIYGSVLHTDKNNVITLNGKVIDPVYVNAKIKDHQWVMESADSNNEKICTLAYEINPSEIYVIFGKDKNFYVASMSVGVASSMHIAIDEKKPIKLKIIDQVTGKLPDLSSIIPELKSGKKMMVYTNSKIYGKRRYHVQLDGFTQGWKNYTNCLNESNR